MGGFICVLGRFNSGAFKDSAHEGGVESGYLVGVVMRISRHDVMNRRGRDASDTEIYTSAEALKTVNFQ